MYKKKLLENRAEYILTLDLTRNIIFNVRWGANI